MVRVATLAHRYTQIITTDAVGIVDILRMPAGFGFVEHPARVVLVRNLGSTAIVGKTNKRSNATQAGIARYPLRSVSGFVRVAQPPQFA